MMEKKRGRPPRSGDDIAGFRSRIAESALAIYRAEGFDAVSIRRLAKDVGCAPATIYAHFDGKIDILRHLWADVLAEMAKGIQSQLATVMAPEDRLKTAALAFVSYWTAHPENFRLVFMSHDVSRSDVDAFLQDEPTKTHFDIFPNLVARAYGFPDTAIENADTLIAGLIGISLCLNTIGGHEWPSASKMVDRLIGGMAECR